ncbi:MAG: flagellar motor switch phosphatase FliY [Clostridiaceae bacterium]|nr:flagellar motor switch phosphatase FliY [Clostridiaceae bacterium]
MDDMLSQAEIDALLSGSFNPDDGNNDDSQEIVVTDVLTAEEIDALGEIGNISMGTSATTLYMLLGHKVTITTPKVSVMKWEDLSKQYPEPYVAVKIKFTNGIMGDNLLIIREPDVKIITDLMMGGSGTIDEKTEITELHLSAISEAMNQMVGSAATSLSSMFHKRVEISPPESLLVHFAEDIDKIRFDRKKEVVVVGFTLKVGKLIDSSMMQLLPIDFAKEMVYNLIDTQIKPETREKPEAEPEPKPSAESRVQQEKQAVSQQNIPQQEVYDYSYTPNTRPPAHHEPPVNVRPAEFQSFDSGSNVLGSQNINLLMDVPLQITVELGRTSKKIKEILEFGQGSIIELDKLSGEPVDILVNGKNIAKGEVVVIDESFGVRITDIIHPSKRL